MFVGLTNAELGAKALYDVENAFFDEVLGARRVLPPFVELADDQLAAYAGRYENSDATADIRAEDGGLVLDDRRTRSCSCARSATAGSGSPTARTCASGSTSRATGFVRLGSRLAARVA